MMKHLLLALALIATPALADRRIAQIEYDPDRVVTIAGHRAVQTMIEFSDDEAIENIALGDSAAWQVTPNKRANLVFVKPLLARSRTNMTVITNRRRYLFELYQGIGKAAPLYTLRFTYPVVPLPEPLAIVSEPVAPPAPPQPPALNRKWQARGDQGLIPAAIYDDGASTFIAWPSRVELPAILTQDSNGNEGAVNFTVKGDYIVVDGVAPRYVLHRGKASAVLVNGAPRPPEPIKQEPAP